MKLLVADDSGLYRTMLKTLLDARGYEVLLAANGLEAQHILDGDDAPRLAILDCFMPGLTGLDLCELIRARDQGYVYIILLSATDQQGDVLRAFELGADDYLCKPLKEPELIARVKVGERIVRTYDELARGREALRFEASHDSLLPLWNRKAIMNLLNTEISRAKRLATPLSVFFTDLDLFKLVNDKYGHLVGDEVLRSAAEQVTRAVREYDHVGRCGGEEFLVVLPNCTSETALEVAERVRRHIAGETIVIATIEARITVSIGVSEWHSGQEIPDLLHRADAALYRAKQNGRNRVELEGPGLTSTGRRQEVRHSLALPVRIWGMDASGQMFDQYATTVDVTTTGAQITDIKHLLQRGCVIGLEHCSSSARYRVTWVGSPKDDSSHEVGVQLIDTGRFIWGRVIPRVFGDS